MMVSAEHMRTISKRISRSPQRQNSPTHLDVVAANTVIASESDTTAVLATTARLTVFLMRDVKRSYT
jgi:hypothetical protein